MYAWATARKYNYTYFKFHLSIINCIAIYVAMHAGVIYNYVYKISNLTYIQLAAMYICTQLYERYKTSKITCN